jgi:hypothetical protein
MLNICLITGHSYGPIEDTMEIIRVTNKGRIMDTIEKYHIYIANHNGFKLNGTHTHNINPTFDTLCKFQQQNIPITPTPTPYQQVHTRPHATHVS